MRDADVPVPPFWGAREMRIDWRGLDQLLPHVDRNTLFRHHWGYRGIPRVEWDLLARTDLEPRLQSLWRDAKLRRWLEPAGAYGYFPVQADGDTLRVYSPPAPADLDKLDNGLPIALDKLDRRLEVAAVFTFPRQTDDGTPRTRDRLCIADYFRTVASGEFDVLAVQVVTAGQRAGDHAQALMARGEYDQGLKVHGIAASVAEGMADLLNVRVRTELGLTAGGLVAERGKRYSWGYGACPDLSDQVGLVSLMPEVVARLGVSLTTAFQWDPEQSTAAFIVHHPQATYFNVLDRPGDAPLDDVEA